LVKFDVSRQAHCTLRTWQFSDSGLKLDYFEQRIAVGPQQGRKAFIIRTLRALDRPDPGLERVAKANGFSLHAGVSCEGHQRDKRERLCRYIARPAVAVPRLSLSSTGKVVYTLKTPYRDGTTQVAFDRGGHPPVDFVARMAALVPKPRVNLTRLCGAPHSRVRLTLGFGTNAANRAMKSTGSKATWVVPSR